MMKYKEKFAKFIKCECGYNNNQDFVMYSGVCHCCGKVLDPKAKFKAEMNKKMKLWRNKKRWNMN